MSSVHMSGVGWEGCWGDTRDSRKAGLKGGLVRYTMDKAIGVTIQKSDGPFGMEKE
jgi:hypothetical protein